MDDASLVRSRERLCNLPGVVKRRIEGYRPLRRIGVKISRPTPQQVVDGRNRVSKILWPRLPILTPMPLRRLPLDQLHDQVIRSDVVELADVRMIQRGDGAGFDFESIGESFGG